MNRTDRTSILADLADVIARARDAGLRTGQLETAADDLRDQSSPSASNCATRRKASGCFREARRILEGIGGGSK